MATLIDSNVILDVITADPVWAVWSARRIAAAEIRGSLLINDIIFAEISTRFDDVRRVRSFVNDNGLASSPIPDAALFQAGRAFQAYRRRGGTRTGVLPDFFIGAQAEYLGLPLLTRDVGRYRTYFPKVTLIAPEE